MVNSDDLAKLELAAAKGLPIDLSGVEITEETADAFEKLKAELEQAPEGSMVEIPYEWAEPNAYKGLIEATYKASGEPRGIAELDAEDLANGQTPITFG